MSDEGSDVGDEEVVYMEKDLPKAAEPVAKAKPKQLPASSSSSSAWKAPPMRPLPPAPPMWCLSNPWEDAPPPTQVTVMGFAQPYEVWIGGAYHALSDTFLEKIGIERLVRCTTYRHNEVLKMNPTVKVHETVLTVEWADVGRVAKGPQRWNYYQRLRNAFMSLSLMRGNMYFYCKRGFHRSSAVLSMWLLFHWPQEDPEKVMDKLKALRPGIQFFERPGKYPALKEVVLGWSAWLRQPVDPEDAACRHAEHWSVLVVRLSCVPCYPHSQT